MKIHIDYHKTDIGELILGTFDGKICILDFRYRKMRTTVDNRIKSALKAEFIEQSDPTIEQAKKEVDEYLSGVRIKFDIPIIMLGTDFQKEVWTALLQIPYGRKASYLDLAKAIKKPRAVRAVAAANGANAIALVIPCHRIIASNGELGGYGGGLRVKRQLLQLEESKADDLFCKI